MDKPVYCPDCISFGIDCNPDVEEYSLPCERFKEANSTKEPEKTDPEDIPLEELITMCLDVLDRGGTFWIKFTCEHCGARQTSDTPNKIHIDGYSCEECGKVTIPKLWGITVMFVVAGDVNQN